jgi:hypothetical protein
MVLQTDTNRVSAVGIEEETMKEMMSWTELMVSKSKWTWMKLKITAMTRATAEDCTVMISSTGGELAVVMVEDGRIIGTEVEVVIADVRGDVATDRRARSCSPASTASNIYALPRITHIYIYTPVRLPSTAGQMRAVFILTFHEMACTLSMLIYSQVFFLMRCRGRLDMIWQESDS